MPVRTGRFRYTTTLDATGKPKSLTVVDGKGRSRDSTYRLYNTGSVEITITYEVAGNVKTSSLKSSQSVDFIIRKSIKVHGPEGQEITGIYELVNSDSTGRTGKFVLGGPTNPAVATIVTKGVPGAYRIFNSGRPGQDIKVQDQAALIATLGPGQSIDVAAENNVRVRPTGSTTGEGVYQAISRDIEVRNGRFTATAKDTDLQTILHLSKKGRFNEGFYRLFNSGENAIRVTLDDGTSNSFEHDVPPEASFDFQVVKNNGKDTVVSVSGDDSTTAKDIEGSYVFLGS